MARRSGRFKAVDGDGDDMEVEGMLVDVGFVFLPPFLLVNDGTS
jgi:hypothetical protein